MTQGPYQRLDQVKRRESEASSAYPDRYKDRKAVDASRVRVELPDEPPALTPEAARALLRILRTAYAQRFAPNEYTPRSGEEEGDQ